MYPSVLSQMLALCKSFVADVADEGFRENSALDRGVHLALDDGRSLAQRVPLPLRDRLGYGSCHLL